MDFGLGLSVIGDNLRHVLNLLDASLSLVDTLGAPSSWGGTLVDTSWPFLRVHCLLHDTHCPGYIYLSLNQQFG